MTIDAASTQQDLTDPAGEELLHHVGVDDPEKRGHEDREPRQDPAGHPSLSSERLDQSPNLRALADGADDGVEDLGRVAARRALQLGEERDLLDVAVRHPTGELPHRLFRKDAEPVVLHHARELRARRLVGVVDDDAEGTVEAVAGAKGGSEHLQTRRELLGELVANRLQLPSNDHRGQ